MSEWITVADAANVLKVSERTVRRRIESGKLKARRDGRSWLIHSSLSEEGSDAADVRTDADNVRADTELIKELRERIQQQADQVQNQSDRIERLEQLLAMEKQQNQQLIDYQLQPFWKKWFGKQKALPGPGGVVDMEPEGAKRKGEGDR